MNAGALYAGREQTLVKHFILERYLERFAHIIGSWADAITYVDGFSGPWSTRSEDLHDSSFSLAIEQLRRAQRTHEQRGRKFRIRCFFVEQNRASYDRLRVFAENVGDAEIRTRNAPFDESIDEILAFVRSGGPRSFPFIFIDPTGWTGFAMDRIGPLLRLAPGEALINFMTQHIRRFIESPQEETRESFARLFGSGNHRERIVGLAKQDREDELVRAYTEAVRSEGRYKYVCPAIVLHREIDRTHFHLIYATRNAKGVEVFKQVEKKAMEMMAEVRADAQQRHRRERSGQAELFGSEVLHNPSYYETLRERYLVAAKNHLTALLERNERVLFDAAWVESLRFPLVWDSDVKAWIKDQQDRKLLRLEGLSPGKRVPKRGAGHYLVWGHGASHE